MVICYFNNYFIKLKKTGVKFKFRCGETFEFDATENRAAAHALSATHKMAAHQIFSPTIGPLPIQCL